MGNHLKKFLFCLAWVGLFLLVRLYIDRRLICQGERRERMRREEARHPAPDSISPLNSQNYLNYLNSGGADPFDGECLHGLSDPLWCNICSKNLEAQAAMAAQGHNVGWSPEPERRVSPA